MRSLFIFFLAFLTQCTPTKRVGKNMPLTRDQREEIKYGANDKLFEEPIFTTKKKKGTEDYGLGVNSYLWRACIEVFSFMPFHTVDPFSGIIVTDWYSAPHAPHERIKLNVIILDPELRVDALKITLFHQVYDQKKGWIDTTTNPEVVKTLEDTVFTRARQFRVKILSE